MKKQYKYIFDLDGTLFSGQTPHPFADSFIHYLNKTNREYLAFTNCPEKDSKQISAKLSAMNIPISSERIINSGQVAAWYIKNLPWTHSRKKRVYLIGSPSMAKMMTSLGLIVCENAPDYVVVAFDRDITYSQIKKACLFIQRGAAFIATNPDTVIPSEEGAIPHTGAIAASIQAAVGQAPLFMGKPSPKASELIQKRLRCDCSELCILGDRIDTDMMFGYNSGMDTALLLTGCTSLEDITDSARPFIDMIFNDIGELMKEDMIINNFSRRSTHG